MQSVRSNILQLYRPIQSDITIHGPTVCNSVVGGPNISVGNIFFILFVKKKFQGSILGIICHDRPMKHYGSY